MGKLEELSVLHRIAESISTNLDLEAVLRGIVEIVVKVTRADACLLYLFDPMNHELILRASKNPHPRLIGRIKLEMGEGITGWVARERRPVVIAENASDDPRFKFFHNLPEDRYQAFLSVPVMAKNEVVGVINVQHKRRRRYQKGETALLLTIAHQVGGAIENARLYEQMKRKAMQLETLAQVSRTIVSNRYLEEILHLLVTMTAGMMSSTICSIMLLDEEKKELKIAATQSLSDEYRKKANVQVGESISGRVVQEKKPMAIADVRIDPHYQYREVARQEGLCSLLSVPMMIKERAIGVINSYTSSPHHFTEEEISLLQAVANQAAVAIENTNLMQRSVAMQEALESRKVVERAKGLLMQKQKVSEDEAFRLIQKQSMNTRRSMREIAEALLLAEAISR